MADEVLVHISTPATRQNDGLFRSLANAYITFQPYQAHRDEPVGGRAKIDHIAGLYPDADFTRTNGSVTREVVDPSILTASKESYGSFPSNLSSDGHYHDPDPAGVDDTPIRPTSRLAQLDRSYLNWRKRATPKSNLTGHHPEPRSSLSGLEDADTGFIEDSQLALQALQSQLQDTYSTTSADTSEGEEKDEGGEDEIIETITRRSSRELSPTQCQHSELAGVEQSLAALQAGAHPNLADNLLEKPTTFSIYSAQGSPSEIDPTLDRLDFSVLPIDAFPPAPAISVTRPGTLPSQITKHLAAIKVKNPDRFKPLVVRRSLEADERGYWSVDCMQWSPKIQQDFWSLLHEHVSNGRIGWAITLHRQAESSHTLGHVRLYCWGEVAEHTWLLLWLCSKGQLSSSASKWIDANGVAVVEL